MSCESIEPELVAYHFATVSPEVRLLVEEHLATCPACLKTFFALKRELETEPDSLPRPSVAARNRLRVAVAAQVRLRNAPQPWQWWERPLAFASAAVVVFLALAATFAIATAPPSAPVSISCRPQAGPRSPLVLRWRTSVPLRRA